MTALDIRDAEEGDLPAILAIYNDVIATTTAVFSETPVSLENRRAWLAGRRAGGHAVLVATTGGEVAGFGALGPFRLGDAYRATAEDSVHVRADRRGGGVGSALLAELLVRARAAGRLNVMAGLDAANVGSVRLHERQGFVREALLPGVAEKWGRPLDLLFMRRRLREDPGRR